MQAMLMTINEVAGKNWIFHHLGAGKLLLIAHRVHLGKVRWYMVISYDRTQHVCTNKIWTHTLETMGQTKMGTFLFYVL